MKNKRQPRPRGYTELAHLHTKDPNHITQDTLHKHIIDSYIGQGFMFCGEGMDIPTLSQRYKIPVTLITAGITQHGTNVFSQADPDDKGDILRALIGLGLENTLVDRQRAVEQYSILRASQGAGYKAFVSSEVNKALKLTMEGTKGILDMYRSLAGANALSVVINQNTNELNVTQSLSPAEALELIQQNSGKAPLLKDREAQDALYLEHNLDDMPFVNAHEQSGLDTSREGQNISTIATVSESLLNDVEDAVSEADGAGLGHADRRAEALNIDLDNDQV